ncbi:MAG: Na(+)-translocating NADH-quinone reductase subunit A [Muribaculaceae bacterium]|nr:Na(+)-translocating NADH-quinone reductase subunit A [Muribaculaceae bacterium]
MAEVKKIKKGLDICLYGKASGNVVSDTASELFAVCPDDYPGYVWKLCVQVGDSVLKGGPLMHDKNKQQIFLCSPVSGVVTEIIRGERRKIEAVVVKSDGSTHEKEFKTPQSCQDLIDLLCQSGLWAMMRQRPYDIIPDPDVRPRDIFVTAFDSAPLAPEMISSSDYGVLEEGLKALRSLTDGKVYLGVKFGSGISSSAAIVTEFVGPHPAGNVGVQIANISPVNKGDVVWCLDARTVCRIGRLLSDGVLDMTTTIALTGELVDNPHMIKTSIGAAIPTLIGGQLSSKAVNPRVISGNVLTGVKVSRESGFLRYPYRQITVINEGDSADEFMGWASLNPLKYSVKRTFPAFLRGLAKPFRFDARLLGGRRAMIVSGEYDKVFPMDIYPEYLIKAILTFNIDRMEQLGIYEVAPEDFALAEFVDTSKLELQKIVREGLERLRKELS